MTYYNFRYTFYRIDRNAALLYEPIQETDNRHIGIVTMHSDADYLDFWPGAEFAKRGYTSLCAVPPRGTLDEKMKGLGACVRFMRDLDWIDTVLILGHSGGATLNSAYQAYAENGSDYFNGPEKIYKCPDIGKIEPADGFMCFDSNWGNGMIVGFALHPGIISEDDPSDFDPSYDLFDAKNGFSEEGSTYSAAFIKHFQHGQEIRMNRIIDHALDRLKLIESGKGFYEDDEPLTIPGVIGGAMDNLLFPQDIRLLHNTEGEWPLIHADGSVSVEKVNTVRKAKGKARGVHSVHRTMRTTVREFLAGNAARMNGFSYDDHAVYGVDWDATWCNTPGNVKGIHVPALVCGMTGSFEFTAAETIYRNLPSIDKSLAYIEGAGHSFDTNKKAESFPGQYGDTVKILFDYAASWINRRW